MWCNLSKLGFRTSVFGFNKDDVNTYLLNLSQEFSLKEQDFIKKISDLEKQIDSLKKECNSAKDDLNKTTDELKDLKESYEKIKDKEEEIEQMSQSIGTMYMVAMQNSEKIISQAEETATQINQASMQRLDAAYKAEEQLGLIKENIKTSAKKFAEEINAFSTSLEEPKNRLAAQLEAQSNTNLEIPTEIENGND